MLKRRAADELLAGGKPPAAVATLILNQKNEQSYVSATLETVGFHLCTVYVKKFKEIYTSAMLKITMSYC